MGVPLILYAGSAVSENTLLLGFSVNRDNGSLLPTRWTTYSRTFSSRQEGYGPRSVSQKIAFSRSLRGEADERLRLSLRPRGSAIHAFVPSRSALGNGRAGRRYRKRSPLGVAVSRPILGCPSLSALRLSPRLSRRSVHQVSLSLDELAPQCLRRL